MERIITVVSERFPRIVLNRPVLTDEEREHKNKEMNSEFSKLFWESERRKALKASQENAV